MKTPIIILTLNRPIQLKDMVESIEACTDKETYEIIICDNGSKQKEMLELLDSLSQRCVVIRNNENKGFYGFNSGLELVKTDKFILSDPDIRFNVNMPRNWLSVLSSLLDSSNSPKVGLALNINFNDESKNLFKERELLYWQNPAPYTHIVPTCYYAPVDTTFAMYRKDTFTHWKNSQLRFDNSCIHPKEGYVIQKYNSEYKESPIRVAGDFTAEHMGWYVEAKYIPDWEHYSRVADIYLSSTVYLSYHQAVSLKYLGKDIV